MIDITEDLKLYKELEPLFEKAWRRFVFEDLMDGDWSDHPSMDDPRVVLCVKLKNKLEQLAIHSASVTITDPTLHRVFHAMRLKIFDEGIDENGCLESNELYDDLLDQYNPRKFVAALKRSKPLIALNSIPPDVDRLIAETREAYCLGLPTACISLCRSTVERVIVDIAIRCGRVDPGVEISEMGMCERISLLIDRSVSRNSPLRQRINAFMAATSNVIHSNTDADMDSALKLYQDSISLIQELYGAYQKQFKKPQPSH
jgi:hypothetical protein